MSTTLDAEPTAVLDVHQLAALLRISTRTIDRLRKTSCFPQPLPLGSKLLRWSRVDVEEWLRRGDKIPSPEHGE